MRIVLATLAALAIAAPATWCDAQTIPIRALHALTTTDSGLVKRIDAIHVLSDGRVLVNDGTQFRLLLLDPTLKRVTVVADTGAGAPVSYGEAGRAGRGNGGILPFAGDSTAFVDIPSKALVVFDAQGRPGRITTPPVISDMGYFSAGTFGVPGFDTLGRLYYRSTFGFRLPPAPKDGVDTMYFSVDSAPLLRADFDARRVDTIAILRTPLERMKLIRTVRTNSDGTLNSGASGYTVINPLPYTDEWAYLTDGTVAIVRGKDYHVDWLMPDGTRQSSPKMPFDWRRVTQEDKQRIVDSVHTRLDSALDACKRRALAANPSRTPESLASSCRQAEIIGVNELPDYYPPIRAGSQVRADADGNLWILPTTSAQAKGGYLYDVVDRKGQILERVQFPEGRMLAGFGPRDIVYMVVPPEYGWARLEQARIAR